MNTPKNLKYSKSHEWVEFLSDDKVRIGLTDFAQNALGDIVFINLPEENDEFEKGESFADVESVKAVSDVFSPFTGKISAINEDVLDSPEKINEDPYENWLVEMSEISDQEELLDADDYDIFCEEEEE